MVYLGAGDDFNTEIIQTPHTGVVISHKSNDNLIKKVKSS